MRQKKKPKTNSVGDQPTSGGGRKAFSCPAARLTTILGGLGDEGGDGLVDWGGVNMEKL